MHLKVLYERKNDKRGEEVKAYHISPNASIPKFIPRHSQKHGKNGIFICTSWESLLDDWLWTLASKRFGKNVSTSASTIDKRRIKAHERHDDCFTDMSLCPDTNEHKRIYKMRSDTNEPAYKSLTIYKLSLPKYVFDAAKKEHNRLAEIAINAGGVGNIGAWGWGNETFIPEEYLDKIKIIGRRTLTSHDIHKLSKKYYLIDRTRTDGIVRKLNDYRKIVEELINQFGRAPLLVRAEKYLNSISNIRQYNISKVYKTLDGLIEPYLNQRSQLQQSTIDK